MAERDQPGLWERGGAALILLVAGVFLALHAVHLTADFPNNSPWMDFAKYTDEGWYGDAAIRHLQRGTWYVPGDFNPAAALPVWPLLEFVVFRMAGVSQTAARGLSVAVFGAILVALFALMRRWGTGVLAAAGAVLLLAASPFCFAFSRLAILEPLVVLLSLLAMVAVPRRAPPHSFERLRVVLVLGFLLPAMVLTKTTALFLVPAIFYLLWASADYRWRDLLRLALPTAALGASLWAVYFLTLVSPHYLADFRYVFSANRYTGMTAETAWPVISQTIADGMWLGPLLFPLGLLTVSAVCLVRRRNTPPLILALLLWLGSYAAFIAGHANVQPRYYLILAVPFAMLLPISLEEFVRAAPQRSRLWVQGAAVGVIGLIVLLDGRKTLGYVLHTEYSFVSAAEGIRRIVVAERGHSQLLLSGSGSDLSLMTGLPSICDDFGTMQLAERVANYRPGWFVAWNAMDDDKMETLDPLYRVVRVAAFPAFDHPSRNQMILYRLDPRDQPPSVSSHLALLATTR